MLATVFGLNPEKKQDIPKEGELFKIIQLFGKTLKYDMVFMKSVIDIHRMRNPFPFTPTLRKNPCIRMTEHRLSQKCNPPVPASSGKWMRIAYAEIAAITGAVMNCSAPVPA